MRSPASVVSSVLLPLPRPGLAGMGLFMSVLRSSDPPSPRNSRMGLLFPDTALDGGASGAGAPALSATLDGAALVGGLVSHRADAPEDGLDGRTLGFPV